uniref:Mitochondrial fission factor n=1 Tax=Pipistrellus kuhlii TaxID=59472 RepID=A0A7J7ZKJ0_PIPKU|nr:hypothetical protein mPipKuh1_011481 [Pipistrellus kuhlii]
MSGNAVSQNRQLARTDSMCHRSDFVPRSKISRFQALNSAPGYTVRRLSELHCESPMLNNGSMAIISSPHNECIRYGISNTDTIEGTLEDLTVVRAASLKRQIIKLNRRLQLIEEENKERAKRETVMCSITVAFWLFNVWLWFRR